MNFDSKLLIPVSSEQKLRLRRHADDLGISMSAVVRRYLDDLENLDDLVGLKGLDDLKDVKKVQRVKEVQKVQDVRIQDPDSVKVPDSVPVQVTRESSLLVDIRESSLLAYLRSSYERQSAILADLDMDRIREWLDEDLQDMTGYDNRQPRTTGPAELVDDEVIIDGQSVIIDDVERSAIARLRGRLLTLESRGQSEESRRGRPGLPTKASPDLPVSNRRKGGVSDAE